MLIKRNEYAADFCKYERNFAIRKLLNLTIRKTFPISVIAGAAFLKGNFAFR